MLRRWWGRKYNLPHNHPLFEESYVGDLLEQWYEDVGDAVSAVENTIDETPDITATALQRLQKRRNDLRATLGLAPTPYTGDVVMDVWEMQDEPDWSLQRDVERAKAVMAKANARRLDGDA